MIVAGKSRSKDMCIRDLNPLSLVPARFTTSHLSYTFLEDGCLKRAIQGSCLLVERFAVRGLGLYGIQLRRLLLQDFTNQQLSVKRREHSHRALSIFALSVSTKKRTRQPTAPMENRNQ